jgi:hypothetical protein
MRVEPTRPVPDLPSDLPDKLDADVVLTVSDVRPVVAAGFMSGVLVPLIPLALLGLVGIAATAIFNRGTTDFGSLSSSASAGNLPVLVVFLLFLLGSGTLGAVMGAVRRWSVQRGLAWQLLVGNYFSSHPGPQSVIALVVVPLLVLGALHAISVSNGYLVSIAPVFFVTIPPAWILAGFMYEGAWEALVFPMLRFKATEPMKWLSREAALFRLLKDDSYLFECGLRSVSIDSATGVAHINGTFRTPDHYRRVREIALRVVGVTEVDVRSDPRPSSESVPYST